MEGFEFDGDGVADIFDEFMIATTGRLACGADGVAFIAFGVAG